MGSDCPVMPQFSLSIPAELLAPIDSKAVNRGAPAPAFSGKNLFSFGYVKQVLGIFRKN